MCPREKLAKLKIKTFQDGSDEWTKFVLDGRSGRLQHDFDIVSGPMLANPNRGKPIAFKQQTALFSEKAAKLFEKNIKGIVDCK